jgi:hypothetical protein
MQDADSFNPIRHRSMEDEDAGVMHAGTHSFPVGKNVLAVSAGQLAAHLAPL